MSGPPWEAHYERGLLALSAGNLQLALLELNEAINSAALPSDLAAVCNDLGTT
jgi:hypothetical protein